MLRVYTGATSNQQVNPHVRTDRHVEDTNATKATLLMMRSRSQSEGQDHQGI